jgi:sugar phosphate permease
VSLAADPRRRRWLLWGILALGFLLVSLHRLSTAVLSESLMTAFGTTGAGLGTLHAAFFVVYALMQIPTGILVDRFGPRRTAAVGGVVMNVGALGFAAAGGYAAALVARLLIGLGGSVLFVATLRFCANWFRADEFGTMNGLSFGVSGIGGILATTPFALAVGAAGWRATVAGLGAVGLAVAAGTYLFVRDSPEQAGLPPIEGVPEREPVTAREARNYLSAVVRDPVTWAAGIVLFCTAGVNLTVFGLWGVPYVVQMYDTSVTVASLFTLAGSVGVMVGPPAIGRLSDRTGIRAGLTLAGTALHAATLTLIAVVGDPPLPVVGGAFLLTGGLIGAFVLTYPVIKERHPGRASGIALGTINGSSFFGAAAFPTLLGAVLDAYWTGETVGGVRVYTPTGYRISFGIGAAAGLVAVGCAAWLYRHESAAGGAGPGAGPGSEEDGTAA